VAIPAWHPHDRLAAIGPMIARLPPVGQRIPLGPLGPPPEFPGFTAVWLDSGTSALSVALQAALVLRAPAREIILPAYGCPDLIAATLFAGGVPVLVDCRQNDPGFDLTVLEAACTDRTAAVVAVNLLGVRERLVDIRTICDRHGAFLVEDCAQWFPEGSDPAWVDARIISFGRGKPINLLGGGCLLLPCSGDLAVSQPELLMPPLSRASARVFDALLLPTLYGLISRIPQLHVGETRFHPLQAIRAMDRKRMALAGAAITAWTSAHRWREERYAGFLGRVGLDALPVRLVERAGRLLRYPILAPDAASRGVLVNSLVALGASPFYGRALPFIPGIPPMFREARACRGAQDFAARLFTLPLHEGVSGRHIVEMEQIVEKLQRNGRLIPSP
jgi:hypothetical protein